MQSIVISPEKTVSVASLISSVMDIILLNSSHNLLGLHELPKIKFKEGRGKMTVRKLLRRK